MAEPTARIVGEGRGVGSSRVHVHEDTGDLAPDVARRILDHPSGDLMEGFADALHAHYEAMTWPTFKRGVEIAIELARADGRMVDGDG